jgi:hypothetical protein
MGVKITGATAAGTLGKRKDECNRVSSRIEFIGMPKVYHRTKPRRQNSDFVSVLKDLFLHPCIIPS